MQLPKHYDPKAVEQHLYRRWESRGYFHEEPDPARPPFVVCMPPPNVTGRAHLGHGSTYTPMDVLVRYHRMLGDNADWLPGLDHAAIATETVVVKQLTVEGSSREALGREAFVERAWKWSREYGGAIEDQFRMLGFGPDWQRARFTMDDGMAAAVVTAFVRLYREGLIYRGKRLVNWDPKGQTTISDAEVDHVERDAMLWHVRYPFEPGDRDLGVEIATTRPETMLGDVAIAVHPDDSRYAHLIGRTVCVPPLMDRSIPIVADAAVDPQFGTGAVKVTPAHDPVDYEIGVRHGLPMPSVIGIAGNIVSDDVSVGAYAGLNRFEARRRIVDDLRASGLLVAQRPHRHAIAISERSGDVVEPLLSLQWFLKMESLATPALDAYRDGRLTVAPERYGRTYAQWLENIRDWNISRQLWWGHRLPVWYTAHGDPVVAHSEAEAHEIARRDFGTNDLTRDPDTLDTWFSSGIWPFSILGWPQESPELRYWYPSQVLVTGGDIIFLWVARMVMLGQHLMGQLPFSRVFVTPLVFDAEGRKMSKSLGNAIDPIDLVERFGADAFRMGILRQMRLEGQEIRFTESRCEEARNFNNKIWNATRYVLGLPEGLPGALTLPAHDALTLADRWILARLHETTMRVTKALDTFDIGIAAETIWRFIWYDYCDWYLEASKHPSSATSRAPVLSFVLNNAMRLLHPVCPFVSEEIWLALPHDGESVVTAAWPDPLEIPIDRAAALKFEAVRRAVERVRNVRAELGVGPKERVTVEIPSNADESAATLIGHFANAEVVRTASAGADSRDALYAITVRAPAKIMHARYHREVQRLRAEIERLETKLADEGFVAKAPAEVVAKDRVKLSGYRADSARAQAALDELGVGETVR